MDTRNYIGTGREASVGIRRLGSDRPVALSENESSTNRPAMGQFPIDVDYTCNTRVKRCPGDFAEQSMELENLELD